MPTAARCWRVRCLLASGRALRWSAITGIWKRLLIAAWCFLSRMPGTRLGFRLPPPQQDKWAGAQFLLSPWRAFWHAVLFGWLRADGTRRFRKGYQRVARKNGKTTMMAGTGLYLLTGDGVPGAEVYTAATKLDQAKLTHKEAEMMVLQSPALRRALEVYKNKIFIPGTASLYAPLGADAKTQDGLNPHGALVDELHAHPNSALWDVLDSAMGARSQPLMLAITTAGFNGEESVCVVQDNYLKGILEQQFDDDAYWGVIYEIDDDDDWRNEACWIKANPNLGVSVSLDSLREAARIAETSRPAWRIF